MHRSLFIIVSKGAFQKPELANRTGHFQNERVVFSSRFSLKPIISVHVMHAQTDLAE